ncbi:MAG: VOC family protein [Acetobacteraceae bacterium]|nr:VOC family protein [Acetobacteraceae bacterium]
MSIEALGYVGIGSANLAGWSDFATGLLGMQLVERGRSCRAFRMDDRKQRLVIDGEIGEGDRYIGWEVANSAALDQLAARLEDKGVRVRREPAALADQRLVAGLIAFADPAGNRLEAFYGADTAAEPFSPGRTISGFRTGALGMGHAVLMVDRLDELVPFYRDVLGFGVSDYLTRPFRAFFFHVNPRHHSLALIETGRSALHHIMVETYSLDDVGQAYDLALGEEGRVATTLGRHTNDYMTSFYARSPSEFLFEYGWGGREIDLAHWTPSEMTSGPSLWGHDRTWLSPEQRSEARLLRLGIAADGERAPVQVLEGNHHRMHGACPWWDAAVQHR